MEIQFTATSSGGREQDHNPHHRTTILITILDKERKKKVGISYIQGEGFGGGQFTQGRALDDLRGRERNPLVASTSLKRVDAGWLLGRA